MSLAGLFCLAEAFLVIVNIRVLRPDDSIYFGGAQPSASYIMHALLAQPAVFIDHPVQHQRAVYANALAGFLNSGTLADAGSPAKLAYPLRALPGRAHVLSELVDSTLDPDPRATPEPLAVRVETVVEREKRMAWLLGRRRLLYFCVSGYPTYLLRVAKALRDAQRGAPGRMVRQR
ncbi:hypothetical protein PsYK624_054910 [Phanerochaete sordida]|uniref:Uncharacterized protein n=1 Tax=Phanerochaete sordida TaxID=48140 RepID=A0A9P3G6W1_9APHY|nr:hypothetical protein PsYK624_054910 [Phanerochaete sordida]